MIKVFGKNLESGAEIYTEEFSTVVKVDEEIAIRGTNKHIYSTDYTDFIVLVDGQPVFVKRNGVVDYKFGNSIDSLLLGYDTAELMKLEKFERDTYTATMGRLEFCKANTKALMKTVKENTNLFINAIPKDKLGEVGKIVDEAKTYIDNAEAQPNDK